MMPTAVVPVAGEPAAVLEIARGLQDLAARVAAINGQLEDLRTMAVWESPSGERFDAALRALPDVLDLLVLRYRRAAEALVDWAAELRVAIERSTEAAAAHLQARVELDAVARDLQLAAQDPTSAWHERLRTRQVLALHRAAEAEEQASRTWLAHHDAAEACARRLRAAAVDTMVDGTMYAAVRTTRSLASGVSAAFAVVGAVPSPIQAFALAGAGVGSTLTVGADLLLLVGYGEGSYWEVAKSAGLLGAGKAVGPLSKAAGAGALKGADGRWVGAELRTADRLRAGRTELLSDFSRQRAALRSPVADRQQFPVRLGGTRAPMIGPQQRLHTRTLRIIEDRVEAKIVGINDRWQMARANGRNAVVLQGSSDALTIGRTAGSAASTADRLASAREPEPEAVERGRQQWRHEGGSALGDRAKAGG